MKWVKKMLALVFWDYGTTNCDVPEKEIIYGRKKPPQGFCESLRRRIIYCLNLFYFHDRQDTIFNGEFHIKIGKTHAVISALVLIGRPRIIL